MSRLLSRVRRLEKVSVDDDFLVITVEGGMPKEAPEGVTEFHKWHPEPGEGRDDFINRATSLARATGEKFVTFFALSLMDGLDELDVAEPDLPDPFLDAVP